MSQHQGRYLVALLLLIVAVAAAATINQRGRLPPGESAQAGYQFVADISNWQRTERERVVSSPYDFSLTGDLTRLPLQLGGWSGVDVPQTNLEVATLLEPEQYVYRRYIRPDGSLVWLSLIGSRTSKSFHSPQICYDADGWQIEAGSETLALAQGEIVALRLLGRKALADGSTAQHLAFYFYLWPAPARDPGAGTVLVKVTVPVSGSVEEAAAWAKEFVGTLLTAARE